MVPTPPGRVDSIRNCGDVCLIKECLLCYRYGGGELTIAFPLMTSSFATWGLEGRGRVTGESQDKDKREYIYIYIYIYIRGGAF